MLKLCIVYTEKCNTQIGGIGADLATLQNRKKLRMEKASQMHQVTFLSNLKQFLTKVFLKKVLPIFKYEVTADVTDVNGETRSETTTVKVGYHALIASLQINSVINKESKAAKNKNHY